MKTTNLLKKSVIIFAVLFFVLHSVSLSQDARPLPPPEEFFGFKPGSDRMLFDYEQLISYIEKVGPLSSKMKMIEIGKSPMGKKMYSIFISSEKNIQNLDNLKKINRELALTPDLEQKRKEQILNDGKTFVMATLSMHSTEVGPSQSLPLILYYLLTSKDPEIIECLDNMVYMVIPCHNPDGMDIVVDHYRKYKGTKYEGSSLPRVYHKYTGHDNNRDFVSLTQEDTKAIAAQYNLEWFPQVLVEKHQMGITGQRYFVPPVNDPIAENIDENLWNWAGIFGSSMIKDMTKDGLAGVSQHTLFDDYWPGSTQTSLWKNVISLLTECASANVATPIFVEPNENTGGGKGLAEYKKSVNMPFPWDGGWWKLSDIVNYEISSTISIIKTASKYRKEILALRNDLCRKETEKGNKIPPYYYILPFSQHDESEFCNLINLLNEHGIQLYKLTKDMTIDGRIFKKDDIVIPLAQPFRPFIKEVMERQSYPVRHYTPNGELIKPYDITSWSLPLHRGVHSFEISSKINDIDLQMAKLNIPFKLEKEIPGKYSGLLFSANNNESYKAVFYALSNGIKVERIIKDYDINGKKFPKGSFLINFDLKFNEKIKDLIKQLKVFPEFLASQPNTESSLVKLPKIALIETNFGDADAGWTRFIFDSYNIPYSVIHPNEFEKTDFSMNYNIVIFPDADKNILLNGKYKGEGEQMIVSSIPPEYTKGLGKEGMEKIFTFLDNGGKIISWGRSTALFMGAQEIKIGKEKKEEFQLPVRDISEQLQKSGFFCPGSLLRILLTENSPLTLGMEKEIGVFTRGAPVFSTSIPMFDMDRRVIAKYPEKEILQSGYAENEEKVGNKSAIVWIKKGKGEMVLFGFNPQFRASTNVSYKLLFNSILLPK